MNDLIERDISSEKTRIVTLFIDGSTYSMIIDNPKTLLYRRGGSTHRVVADDGTVHCYAAPETGKSIVSWCPRNENDPVQF